MTTPKKRSINWIQEYVAQQQNSEAPDEFHLWTAVSTIAGALGRKVWFDMGNHIVVPNFYIVFVSPPGVVQKSTTLGAGKDYLKKLDVIHFGPDTVTWQAITDTLIDAQETEELKNPQGVMDYVTMSSLHLAVSELGTFFQEKDTDKINLMTHLWDAPADYTKRTRMDGNIVINNPCINFIAGCTPAWITENLGSYFIGGGLSSRMIFIFADKKARRLAYPAKQKKNHRHKILVEELKKINLLKGVFTMDADAREYGVKFYNRVCDMLDSDAMDPRYKSFISRMQTHYHKIAIVVSASTREDMVIDMHCVETAETLTMLAFTKLQQVYSLIGQTKEVQHHDTVLNVFDLVDKPYLTEQEIFSMVQKQMSHWHFKNALASNIAAKHIGKKQVGVDLVYCRIEGK